jgi:hypothetical protein
MRKLVLGALASLVLGGASLAMPASCQAQAIWGGEIERALRPGAYVPYNGAGYMERYNYESGGGFYLGISGQRVANLAYQDRVDRAIEVGSVYQAPWNPHGKVPLFNRILGQTSVIEGPIPPPYVPGAYPGSFRVSVGTGYWYGR